MSICVVADGDAMNQDELYLENTVDGRFSQCDVEYEGVTIRCPDCYTNVYVSQIVSGQGCHECGFEMTLILEYGDVSNGKPHWERDDL